MSKWFWDCLASIARTFVGNGHPCLGAVVVVFLALIVASTFIASVLIASGRL
jgi:hypothetical protein